MRWITLLTIVFLAACGPSADSETHWGENNDTENGDNANNDENGDDNSQNSDGNSDENSSEPDVALLVMLNKYFDDVPVGDEHVNTVYLENNEFAEAGTVSLDTLSLDGDDFSADPPLAEWPDELEEGETFEADIIFAPSTDTEQTGELSVGWSIDGEDPDTEVYEIQLYGNTSCLSLNPRSLVFEDIDVGDTEVQSVDVTNCGEVSSFEVIPQIVHGPSFPDDTFSFVDDSDFPDTLAGGESFEIEIEYAPSEPYEPSDDEVVLQIETDSSEGTQSVMLRNENHPTLGGCDPSSGDNSANGMNGVSNGGNLDQNDEENSNNMSVNDNNWNYDCGDNSSTNGSSNDGENAAVNGSSHNSDDPDD